MNIIKNKPMQPRTGIRAVYIRGRLWFDTVMHITLRKLLPGFAALAAFITSPVMAEEEGEISYAYYLISCGKYIQHRQSGTPTDNNNTADTFYVAGWLSAYNRLSSGGGVPEDTTLDNVMLWLEGYCRENPLGNLEAGLFKLGEEVKHKDKDTATQKPPVPSAKAPVPVPSPTSTSAPAPASH
jgi:hypothetical protein